MDQLEVRIVVDGEYMQYMIFIALQSHPTTFVQRLRLMIPRQLADLRALHTDGSLPLDPGMDYFPVSGLSEGVREWLRGVRPETLGAAKRKEGVTPAALLTYSNNSTGREELLSELHDHHEAEVVHPAVVAVRA
ncbi:hypothetical protein BKA82DRAFT_28160 [Pisolithus tinctorius]|uniref:tRNA uridine 5-carboxymethylaminomethyl modification enzyme C-terminal subdomain domain-containing protein n=1 Tax=Pisolithus tinctorius Marx 270 TaxID=870435 RepID=A0A0C3IYN8_PISTI|nr:hypothetical protein BKA82DRAFT_4175281 [Pisolithus tinctorius]KAI6144935.1 hypothetical protein BKA82DRAFT_28160 [Pisolithus tinctorius]KIO01903.1 hypothetical protein M404DRAFT_28160 [Pisolithus tinctorius Marx 270]